MKRFYARVTVAPLAQGLGILLDGRPVRTPAGRPLALPAAPLAEAVAAEWRAQEERIVPARMPLTRLATTAIDLLPARRPDLLRETVDYAASDMLCYRAGEPQALAIRQHRAWQPWLDWAERTFGARLVVTEGVLPVAQPQASLRRLEAAAAALDDWRLVGLHAAVRLTGSLVLGLAIERGALDAAAAFELALLEELHEMEQWGEDEEQRRRQETIRCELEAAGRFLDSLPR